MGFPEGESSTSDRKLAIEEIVKGQELMSRLGPLLLESSPKCHGSEARGLVEEVLSSLSRALSALESSGEGSEVCQSLAIAGSDDRKSENSSRKKRIQPIPQGRGGCRRRLNSCSWKRVTTTTMDDGFSWRKYGQKEIYNSKYPRSYFRCTHKHDRNCQAIRQVQRSEEDQSMYVISYMGDHTCGDSTKSSDSTAPLIINFGSSSSMKQEAEEEVLSNLTSGSPAPGFFVPPLELAAFEEFMQPMAMTAKLADENSGMCSPEGSMDMGLIADSIDFDGVFDFIQDDFLA